MSLPSAPHPPRARARGGFLPKKDQNPPRLPKLFVDKTDLYFPAK